MTLNAQIIEENGEPKFAVLPFQDYQVLAAELAKFDTIEDFLDYVHLVKSRSEIKTWHSRNEVWHELGLDKK